MAYKENMRVAKLCQSMIRRHIAVRQLQLLRRERHTKSALAIQTRWRSGSATVRFAQVKLKVVLLQSIVRGWRARKYYCQRKKASVSIASSWRRHRNQMAYKRIIRDVIVCQSCTRRCLAKRNVEILRHSRQMSSATLIQSLWRAVYVNKCFAKTRSTAIRIQSHVRKVMAMERFCQSKRAATRIVACWRRYHCQQFYQHIIRSTIVCQSVIRRSAALRCVILLRHKHHAASLMLIQARWRVFVAKRHLRATKIASQWRRFYSVMVYKRILKVAKMCQSMTRRYFARRQFKLLRYERQTASAAAIQAKWRAFVATELLSQVKVKVVLLQSIVRGWLVEKYFSQCKKASIKITSSWRRHQHQTMHRKIIRGVIAFQSIIRGYSETVKVELLRQNRRIASAALIQGRWRAFLVTKRYIRIKSDVILIQSNVRRMIAERYREHILKDSIMNQAVIKQVTYKQAAATISSQWRLYHLMVAYKQLRKAVIVCQSVARRNLAAKKAKTLRCERNIAAATLIQSTWRTFVAKNWFNRTKLRVTLLQSIVRRLVAERDVKNIVMDKISSRSSIRSIRSKQAATQISSSWRGFNRRMLYKQLIRCVVAFQSVFRRYSAAKRLILRRHEYHVASATSIEARWRAFTSSKRFKLMKSHATLLQSIVRRSWSRRYLSRCKLAATKISSQFRKFQCHRMYTQIRREIILCQSVVRRCVSSRKVKIKRYERRVASAVVIETRWRSFVTKKRFSEAKQKIHLVQSIFRRWRAEIYLDRSKHAVTKISCQWRGILCRMAYKQVVEDVVICQSLARRFAATKYAELLRQQRRGMCVILIQASWRAYNSNKQYIKTKLQAILLQATIRRWRTGRHLAATTISSHWRRFHCLKSYKQVIRDVIACQSIVRRHVATTNVNILRQNRCICAATAIQARWRTFDATENFTRVKLKVALLQSLFRCWTARKYLQVCKTATTKITSTWKMINCRVAYNQIIDDVIVCQTIVRRNFATRKVELLRHERCMASATYIQARWRAFVSTKGFLQTKYQITLLQSVAHRWRAEKYLARNKNAATKIASYWRRFRCLMTAIQIRRDVIICQSIARRKIATNEVRHLAATKFIETQWASFLAEKNLVQIRSHISFIKSIPGAWMTLRTKAATKISSLWRRCVSFVAYRRTLQDVTVCQSFARRCLAIRATQRLKHVRDMISATVIQAKWRARARLKGFQEIRSSIILLQSFARMCFAIVHKRELISKLTAAVTYPIDDFFKYSKKRNVASIKIQSIYRKCRARKMHIAAAKIQTAYRKHLTRQTSRFRKLSCNVPPSETEMVCQESSDGESSQDSMRSTNIVGAFISLISGEFGTEVIQWLPGY